MTATQFLQQKKYSRVLTNTGELIIIFTSMVEAPQPRRYAGQAGPPWFFVRDTGSPALAAGDSLPDRNLFNIGEVLCQVICIAVYIVRPRNNASPGWTTIWPSALSAAMPWPEKTSTCSPPISIARRRQATQRRSGAGASGKRSAARQATQLFSWAPAWRTGKSYHLPLAFFRFLITFILLWEKNSHSFCLVVVLPNCQP